MSGPSNHPAAAYPTWLRPSRAPVVVLVGPPGNDAVAFAHARADGGEVIDIGEIIAELAGVPAPNAGPGWIIPALTRRNERLGMLSRASGCKAVHLVAASPAAWQRQFWVDKLGATIVVLDPGKEHALIGARDLGIPERFVHQWYAEAAASAPPQAMPTTTAREPSSKRGYGNEHRVLRDRQLAREPWCRFHWDEHQVKVPATVLDHILPFHDAEGNFLGKRWGDPANHRSLCQPCHDARGATRSRAAKPPGAGVDGRPLDRNHPWAKA